MNLRVFGANFAISDGARFTIVAMEIALVVGGLLALVGLIALLARAPKAPAPAAVLSRSDVLREVGREAVGKVIFMQPTGNVVGESREFHVTVEVCPPEGRPYRVDLVSVVAASAEHRVCIGHRVPLRINPNQQTDVVLDLATS